MKILLLGGGGREHAIAWKLRKDDPALDLVAAPGNPGIAALGRCVAVRPTDTEAVVALATSERPDLVVIGPEAPLAAGVSDALRAAGFGVFGPSMAAARLESSKRFAKEVMFTAGVPTAAASWHRDPSSAKTAVLAQGQPVVVKASGLAAGKGVVVAQTTAEALQAIDEMFSGSFGSAGEEVLVEEFLAGEELSVFAVTDGEHVRLLLPAQDHKRLYEGDAGPNTGGMGAYTPVSIATPEVMRATEETIITPTLRAMHERGTPFRGLLYVGLMVTADGPKVVEFNARFGDPETQVVLPMLRSRLVDLLLGASVAGGLATTAEPEFEDGAAVTTVVASPGYPQSPQVGAPVVLPAVPNGVSIFHAGTIEGENGALLSSGGRVLAVTAVAGSMADASRNSASTADGVELSGKMLRHDIGWRELARSARTP